MGYALCCSIFLLSNIHIKIHVIIQLHTINYNKFIHFIFCFPDWDHGGRFLLLLGYTANITLISDFQRNTIR